MNIYLYKYIYIYIYIYIYTYIHTYIHISVFIYIYIYIYVYIYVYTCIHVYMYIHIHIHIDRYVHVYIHAYSRIAHIHISCAPARLSPRRATLPARADRARGRRARPPPRGIRRAASQTPPKTLWRPVPLRWHRRLDSDMLSCRIRMGRRSEGEGHTYLQMITQDEGVTPKTVAL